jgi:hypothetical protein
MITTNSTIPGPDFIPFRTLSGAVKDPVNVLGGCRDVLSAHHRRFIRRINPKVDLFGKANTKEILPMRLGFSLLVSYVAAVVCVF